MAIQSSGNHMAVRYRIRVMSPAGRYPVHSVSVGGARLVSREDLILTAVEVRPKEEHGLDFEQFSEMEVLALEETRFLAAVVLSVPGHHGVVFPYFLPSHTDVVGQLPADDDLCRLARDHLASDSRAFASIGEVLPPAAGGPPYDREMTIDATITAELVRRAALTDHLLMRGLGALVRAGMLAQRPELVEAAPMMLYVALEASFQMFRRILQAQGNPNPTTHDAGAYLDQAFNPGVRTGPYFADYWEDRIKMLHPSSRFGTFAIAPLSYDDYYFLRHALADVYGFLITGRVLAPPE